MEQRIVQSIVVLGLLTAVSGCSSVPYTNRSRLMVVAESQDLEIGEAAYREILDRETISRDEEINRVVRRVGERIAAVADKPGYKWEFVVIEAPEQVNAFALPGGKVAVYTGLLPVAVDEAGLATVMGHEVAHALARHGAKRMSQQQAMGLATVGVAIAVSGAAPTTQRAIFEAYGLGMQLGVALPFSRQMESEADQIGLMLMAEAGYDPRAAIGLWQRMAIREQVGRPPEFLSTHPTSATRIRQLQEWMPGALERFGSAQRRSEPIGKLPGAADSDGTPETAPRKLQPRYR
jgi:predicted Zn-dependent protease